jgi:cytoskeletal protein CcmA (bactofilin family)
MALKPLNSVGGFSVGEIPANVILSNADIISNNLTVQKVANLGPVGNVIITGGSANQYLQTDGFGNLTFTTADTSRILNGNSNVSIPSANGNVEISVAGNANVAVFTGTGANITGYLTASSNLTALNANLGNLVTANYANFANDLVVQGNIANANNISVTNNVNAVVGNFSGNINSLNANLGNLATANYVNVAQQINGNTANFSGNVVVPNLTVNLELAGNTANFSGNITAVNANLGNLASANFVNVSSNVNVTNTMQAGNVRTDNLLYANGNPWDLQEAAGANTEIQYNMGDNFAASANFTFNDTTNVLTVNGNANVTNTLLTPNVNSGTGNLTLTSNGFSTVYDNTGNVTFPAGGVVTVGTLVGNVQANINITAPNTTLLFSDAGLVDGSNAFTFNKLSNSVTLTGNLQTDNANLGNLAYANYINAASNVTSNNVTVNLELAANTANFSGNVIVPNLTVNTTLSGNVANFTGNLTSLNASLGNLATANYINVANDLNGNIANFTGNLTSLNAALGNLATANYINVANDLNGNIANFTGNLTAANAALGNLVTANYVNVANDLNVIGNVNAGNLVGTLANGNSNVRIFQDANIELSSNGVSNIVTISDTGLFTSGNIHSTAGYIIANGNVTANSFLVGANLAVTGEANVGSLLTSNITANGNLTITASGSNVNINLVPGGPNGVIEASLARIAQVGGPTQPNDAATKEYVDNSTVGLTIHLPVVATSTTNLNATYANGGSVLTTIAITGGKTIQFGANHNLSIGDELAWDNSFNGIIGNDPYFVYSTPGADTITVKAGYFGAEVTTLTNGAGLSQTARANTGVGATLTNAGANAALSIDSIALVSTNRVLVQGQTNQFENGVYTVTTVGNGSTAWVLTRATDEDTYSPKSTTGMSYGDYFFVQQGLNNAGSSYALTSPVYEILFGLTNIVYSQFSAAQSFTAGNGIAITGTVISANVDNDTTAISSGNIVVKTSANLVTPNLGDATFSSLSWNTLSNGNVSANNLSISSIANITLDLTVGGNIAANGTISSNANVSGLNLTTSGNVQATGNVLANNVNANTLIVVPTANVSNIVNAGNVTITNELSGNTANFSGNVVVPNLTVNLALAGNTANFSGNAVFNGANVTVGNALLGNTANFSGNVVVPNLTVNLELAGNTANFTGNLVAANLVTSGTANVANLNVTANVTSALTPNANLTLDLGSSTQRWQDVYAGNIDASGNLTLGGDLSANNFSANTLTANTSIDVGNTQIYWGQVTTSSTGANQTISSVSITGVTGIEWIVKGVDSAGTKYSVAVVTAVTDGTSADYSTFGTVNLNGTTGSLAVNVSGSNIALQVTPSSSNSTVWVTQYRTL